MPHSGSSGNLNKSVMKEVKNNHKINIVKVDSDSWSDSSDSDEVSGEFSGTIYKDESGNAFIYISQIDGVDVEKLRGDGKNGERKRDDSDDEDPQDAGEALDLFIVENRSREPQMENTQNAPSGY